MTRHEEWIPFSGRCYNCDAAVTGYKDMKGTVKIECKKCHVVGKESNGTQTPKN